MSKHKDQLDWLGEENQALVDAWLRGHQKKCRRCRELAADLSQIVQGFSLNNFVLPITALLTFLFGLISNLGMENDWIAALKSGDIAAYTLLTIRIAIIAGGLVFLYTKGYRDIQKRHRISFELMEFSRSKKEDVDNPCEYHLEHGADNS